MTFESGDRVREYRDLWYGVVLDADNGTGTTKVAIDGSNDVHEINTRYLRRLDR